MGLSLIRASVLVAARVENRRGVTKEETAKFRRWWKFESAMYADARRKKRRRTLPTRPWGSSSFMLANYYSPACEVNADKCFLDKYRAFFFFLRARQSKFRLFGQLGLSRLLWISWDGKYLYYLGLILNLKENKISSG